MGRDPFDPESLRISDDTLEYLSSKKRVPRHRPGALFLKGPIPWNWLTRAASLPGKTLHISVLLWKRAGGCKHPTVRFCAQYAGEWGISAYSARRALHALVKADLITIRQQPGRCPQVTLLDVPEERGLEDCHG
jgi:hypothetical protein